jgi:hypothetical protein
MDEIREVCIAPRPEVPDAQRTKQLLTGPLVSHANGLGHEQAEDHDERCKRAGQHGNTAQA